MHQKFLFWFICSLQPTMSSWALSVCKASESLFLNQFPKENCCKTGGAAKGLSLSILEAILGTNVSLESMAKSTKVWRVSLCLTKLFVHQDSGGSQPEEELFDPGYEPDWAVISTVGTRPRVQEETNGKRKEVGSWLPLGLLVYFWPCWLSSLWVTVPKLTFPCCDMDKAWRKGCGIGVGNNQQAGSYEIF